MAAGIEMMLRRCKAHGLYGLAFSDRTPVCTGTRISTSCLECEEWEDLCYWTLPPLDSATLGVLLLTQSGATNADLDKAYAMVKGAQAALSRRMPQPQ